MRESIAANVQSLAWWREPPELGTRLSPCLCVCSPQDGLLSDQLSHLRQMLSSLWPQFLACKMNKLDLVFTQTQRMLTSCLRACEYQHG